MDFSGPPMVEKFGVDTVANDYIVGACRSQLLESRLIIIDEIGSFELSSDLLYTWVVEVLEGLSPVVAIVDRPYRNAAPYAAALVRHPQGTSGVQALRPALAATMSS